MKRHEATRSASPGAACRLRVEDAEKARDLVAAQLPHVNPLGLEGATARQRNGPLPSDHSDVVRTRQKLARLESLDLVSLCDVAEPAHYAVVAADPAGVRGRGVADEPPAHVAMQLLEQAWNVAASKRRVSGLNNLQRGRCAHYGLLGALCPMNVHDSRVERVLRFRFSRSATRVARYVIAVRSLISTAVQP